MECIFCRIVAGELPARVIHEDRETISFLDINPVALGHCLVLPKLHVEFVHQLPAEVYGPLAASLSRVSGAVAEALGSDGLNIILNSGAVAGQVIPHVHFHVIPRHAGDGLTLRWPQLRAVDDEMERVRRLILRSL